MRRLAWLEALCVVGRGGYTGRGRGRGRAATLESEVREAGVEGLIDMELFGVAMVRLRAVWFLRGERW